MTTFFGLENCLHKPIQELSGGQKQIINLCSVLLLRPDLLLLDEPTSQLDPVLAQEFIKILHQVNQELSLTLVISEHRLDQVFSLADRIIYMEDGQVQYDCKPKEMANRIFKNKDGHALLFLPSITRMFFGIEESLEIASASEIPLSVREGKKSINKVMESLQGKLVKAEEVYPSREEEKKRGESVLLCDEVSYRYNKQKPLILRNLSLSLTKGEFVAILGGNGAGKTTLLQIMAGLLSPQQGSVSLHKKKIKAIHEKERYERIGYVAQNPLLHFVFDTVGEELHAIAQKVQDGAGLERMEEMMEVFDLKSVLSSHPYDISGGQQQKLAIACALISKPEILILDEPTKALDPLSKERFAQLLMQLKQRGLTLVIATHDMEFAASHADKCALLFDGEITNFAKAPAFFSGNYFYTTCVNRVVRNHFPNAISAEEVIEKCKIQKYS